MKRNMTNEEKMEYADYLHDMQKDTEAERKLDTLREQLVLRERRDQARRA